MDQLEATVEGTVYRNAENGYSVVTVKPEQKIGLRTVTDRKSTRLNSSHIL